MKNSTKIAIAVIAVLLVGITATYFIMSGGLGPAHGGKKGKIVVAASIMPIADIVKNIGGNKIKIITILPPGASPHTFEPTPRQLQMLHKADIIFKVGFGLEFWIDKFITTIRPAPVIVNLSEGIQPITEVDYEQREAPGSTENAGVSENTELRGNAPTAQVSTDDTIISPTEEYSETPSVTSESAPQAPILNANPHTWLDPIIAIHMAEKISNTLIDYDPENRDYYEANFLKYQEQLRRLDLDIRTTLAQYPQLKYVTFHPAWDYFDREYGTQRVAVIEEVPGKEPTPMQLRRVIDAIRYYNIPVVFAEPQLNAKVAEIIAKETNTTVVFLDPLGNAKNKNKNTYIKLMRYNLKQMQQAFRKTQGHI